jgi:DNA-binding CsgD family transcriptional regulator
MEVLRCVAKNMTNKQIAKHLHVSLYTVKNHIHNVLEKTNSGTRDEAVGRVLQLRPVEENPCANCPVTQAKKLTQKFQLLAADLRRMADEIEGD